MPRPPNRMPCEAIKVKVGNLPGCYLHIDRSQGRVRHVVLTPSGRHGSDLQQLLQELSRLINKSLGEEL